MAGREALASFHRHHCTFKHPKYIFIFFVQLHDGLVNHAATTHIERSDWRLERNNIHFTSKEFLSKEGLHQQLDNPLDLSKYASLLQGCSQIKPLKQVQAQMYTSGFYENIFLGAKLVSMYAMCGSVEDARRVFDKMVERSQNAFLWNVMIRVYAGNGFCEDALMLYNEMLQTGLQPDKFTFPPVLKSLAGITALQEGKEIHYMIPDSVTMVSVLQACAHLGDLQQGKWIHDYIIRRGFDSILCVENSLIAMYAKCGDVDVARQLFDEIPKRDVVSWNAMIAGYAQNGEAKEALALFQKMQLENIKPTCVTMASALQACAHLGERQQGNWIYDCAVASGLDADVLVGTAIIDMHAKCGSIEVALALFDQMTNKNVVSWNAMIAGCAQNGHADEALALFNQMKLGQTKPNSATMVSVLPACALLGALKQACAHLATLQHGKRIHGYIIRNAFESDIFVSNSLIDMYSKCGKIDLARQVFDKMCNRDVVSWNAIIAGYSMQGYGEHALAIFSLMQRTTTMEPNDVTFLSVLNACSHAGLVYEGWQHFNCMTRNYCISPRMEHYASMVDLLGRAEHLNEAKQFIEKMPLEPGASVWGALLGACRIHGNVELGEVAAEHLFNIEPENTGYYVLMSNIYAGAGRWNDVAKVRVMMNDRGLKKPPGYSSVEVNSRIHTFVAGGRSHPQSEEIYEILNILAGQMKEEGYMPMTHYVLHDVEDEVKEQMISSHSEKLAIACGLINTSPGTPIQITKNLRVCGDCHSGIKFISKIVQREILVRDANRFHLFKDGSCSCRDYW
eukprot:PITA_01111